jgi:hypothetical protein
MPIRRFFRRHFFRYVDKGSGGERQPDEAAVVESYSPLATVHGAGECDGKPTDMSGPRFWTRILPIAT